MHMSEIDLPERLERYGGNVDIVRCAIDVEDTEAAAGVPWFPASDKVKDPRYKWFVENYGTKCRELDALSPVILRERIDYEIRGRLDAEAWERAIEIEAAELESMHKVFSAFSEVFAGKPRNNP